MGFALDINFVDFDDAVSDFQPRLIRQPTTSQSGYNLKLFLQFPGIFQVICILKSGKTIKWKPQFLEVLDFLKRPGA